MEERVVTINDITEAVKEMPDQKGFILADEERGIIPVYGSSIVALFELMNWNFLETKGLTLYAAILPHGKTHVAEVFFIDEETGKYVGSHKVFNIAFPGNEYLEDYDPWLMDELAQKVLGVKREKTIGHNIEFNQ